MSNLGKWVIVSGATGFIGSALTKKLIESGHQVLNLSRSHKLSEDQIRKQIGNTEPVVFYHLAWKADGDFWNSPENAQSMEFTVHASNLAKNLHCSKFIAMGTCAEYDWTTHADEFTVESPIAPASLYGKTKNQAHHFLQEIFSKSNTELVWLRLFFPYGPNQDSKRFIPYLIDSLKKTGKVTCKHPDYTRDYIFMDDIVETLIRMSTKRIQGTFNAGTGSGTKISKLIEEAGKLLGINPEVIYTDLSHPSEPMKIVANIDKTTSALNWSPKVSLVEGLKRMI